MAKALESEQTGGAAEVKRPSEARERPWFTFAFAMIEDARFRELTLFERLVLADVNYRLAEHCFLRRNGVRQGPYCCSDAQWAKRLAMHVDVFRRGRRKLGQPNNHTGEVTGLGWLVFSPGFKMPGGNAMATRYHDAQYAEPQPGRRCATLRRELWDRLIKALKKGQLTHADVATVPVLAYWWELCGGHRHGKVTVPKRQVKDLSGMSMVRFRATLGRLREAMPDLFTFQEAYRSFEVLDWKGAREQ